MVCIARDESRLLCRRGSDAGIHNSPSEPGVSCETLNSTRSCRSRVRVAWARSPAACEMMLDSAALVSAVSNRAAERRNRRGKEAVFSTRTSAYSDS